MKNYKLILNIFYSVIGVLSVVIAHGIFRIPLDHTIYVLIALLLFLFLLKLWYPVYITNIIKNTLPILNTQCDPELFLKKSSSLLRTPFVRNTKEYSFVLLNMAVAYFAQGNLTKALETAKMISKNEIEKNHYLKIVFFYNMSFFYINEEDWAMAESFTKKLERYVESLKGASITKDGKNIIFYSNNKKYPEYFPIKNIDEINLMLEELKTLLELKNEKYQEAITLYEKKFNRTENKYIKSYCRYYQAIWYEELEDMKNMKKALTYTSENGNKLHIAMTARYILAEYKNIF